MFDVTNLIQTGGLLLLAAIVYTEVGLFLGFFLPGDTLLIAAGIYAKSGGLPIISVIAVCVIAAILGDSTAYWIGRKLGPSVFRKPDSVIFNKDHINKAEHFFEKFGAKVLLLSHFIPVIRSFTPLVAGVARMPYRSFFTYTAIGDSLWGISIPLAGYFIGSRIPNIDHYILFIVTFAVAASVIPTLIHAYRLRRKARLTSPANKIDG